VGTAGDGYLSRVLGTDEPLTATATGPGNEITEAEAKAREAERIRVFNARFNPFGDAQATATLHSGGGGGGGYRFDAETIKAKITQWEQLLDDLRQDGNRLRQALLVLRPPSEDKPARQQAAETANSLRAAMDHNLSMQKYAQNFLDALTKANGTYQQHDQDVTDSLRGHTSDNGSLYE
jgi:hypothetical protein